MSYRNKLAKEIERKLGGNYAYTIDALTERYWRLGKRTRRTTQDVAREAVMVYRMTSYMIDDDVMSLDTVLQIIGQPPSGIPL